MQHATGTVLGRRPGSLVIVGSGIKAIGQFTLEARAHVRRADVVYYNVIDPATARWIAEQNPRAVDLYTLYDNDKPRVTSYVQMAELMLRSVRRGADVVGVFYGHPGVFVDASHRAMAIARREGHVAYMLPAVSAIDCLFADLGVDPSRPGCQVVGATDLLLRRRPLLTECSVVILQVGLVGDFGFRLSGPANDGLPVLVRYLRDAYGDDHPVVNYVASEYPTVEPTIDRFTIAQLLEPDVRRRVNEASTFYLPPKAARPIDAGMAAALGLAAADAEADTDPFQPSRALYTRRELDAVAELDSHRVPEEYRPARPSPELFGLIRDLALDPRLLERYEADPELVLRARPGLSDVERAAVLSGDRRWLRVVMQRSGSEVALALVRRVLSDAAAARRYPDLLRSHDISPADGRQAFEELTGGDLAVWCGRYELAIDGRRRGTLTITPSGEVLLDDEPVAGVRFEGGVLAWSEAAGNRSSAALRTLVLTDVDGGPLPAGAYVGPQLRGELWGAGAPRPGRDNAFGKVGVYGAACIADPVGVDPPDLWAGVYVTQLMSAQGTWARGPELDVRPCGGGVELLVGGRPAGDAVYAAGTLSWSMAEPSFSGSVLFHQHGGVRLVGRLWQGTGQRLPAINCVGRRSGDG